MARRMLIDATHREETRVVVVSGNRLEDFDFESSTKQQLKGNIYLAKVTRVEPSLQAAFVDYGGNRHGFLAFSEIHPDYYQIPIADRERLLAQHAALEREEGQEGAIGERGDNGAEGENGSAAQPDENATPALPAAVSTESLSEPVSEAGGAAPALVEESLATAAPVLLEGPQEAAAEGTTHGAAETGEAAEPSERAEKPEAAQAEAVETLGGEEIDDLARKRHRILRQYKIQEVIKRRQILLVQVVKEERGTKGAALTTYLSLAGRYCVLMPNTARGGGVSRKITSAPDRKRLKSLIEDLDLPDGMGLIVRTAGSERTKVEIKRDCDYLVRLWDTIREQTLKSTAPCLIHEEANLIKRAIRDLYARDIDEVLVEGEDGYKAAKDFMKMLMPSHAKRVQRYKDPAVHLFQRFQVESQLDAIHSPMVPLKSGGSIVLNQTEALVAIDVNSGRATRERHIEETALKTNAEAADEIARQLRLRDMAGLVVIDFIDMEESRHNAQVERRLKEAMRHDRARIQLGRISPFGLLELSRQRLRPSLVEASTLLCPHCGGTGHIRSTESTALHVLRAIEEEGVRRKASEIKVYVPAGVALYILNHKRADVAEIEQRYAFHVLLDQDDTLIPPAHRIDRTKLRGAEDVGMPVAAVVPPPMDEPAEEAVDADVESEDSEERHPEPAPAEPGERGARRERGRRSEQSPRGEPGPRGEQSPRGEQGEERGRRRRRRRRGRRGDEAPIAAEGASEPAAPRAAGEAPRDAGAEPAADGGAGEGEAERRRRRRGRRGGRRRGRRSDQPESNAGVPPPPVEPSAPAYPAPFPQLAPSDLKTDVADIFERLEEREADGPVEARPIAAPDGDEHRERGEHDAAHRPELAEPAPPPEPAPLRELTPVPPPEPVPQARGNGAPSEPEPAPVDPNPPVVVVGGEAPDDDKPKRGWWNRMIR